MSRRYLTESEAIRAVDNGKPIECLLGKCFRGDVQGIRWFSVAKNNGVFVAEIYETADLGDINFTDFYSFGPLNTELEQDEPDQVFESVSLKELISILEEIYPGCSNKLVNQFVGQDEYLEYVKRGKNDSSWST